MPPTSAVCRRCGYSALNLPTTICPECGGDLRQVGIHVPNEPRSSILIHPFAACAILIAFPAFVLGLVLSNSVQYPSVVRTVSFAPYQPSSPPGAVQTLFVTTSGTGMQWTLGPYHQQDPVDTITFQLTVVGHPQATLFLTRNGYCITPNLPSKPIDSPLALTWETSAGLDPTTNSAKQLADDIFASTIALRQGRHEAIGFADLGANGINSHGSGRDIRHIWIIPWLIGAFICLFLSLHIRRQNKILPPLQAQCGHCNFPANQFTDLTCPQCKSDALNVGIRTINRHPLIQNAPRIATISVIIFFLGFFSSGALDALFWNTTSQHTLSYIPQFDFHHPAPVQLITWYRTSTRLALSKNSNRADQAIDTLTCTFQIRGHRPLLAYFSKNSFKYFTPAGNPINNPLQLSTLLQFLKAAGLDPSDSNTQKLAQQTLTAVPLAFANSPQPLYPSLQSAGGGTFYSYGEADWLATDQWGIWILLWLILTWRILAKHPPGPRTK